MIEHYQPFLFPFLSSRVSLPNVFTKRYYYWSWEDGLWDLLQKKQIEKGSTILLPDFYCTDVINNMRSHGYIVAFYKLDKHFQIKKQALLRSVQRHHPAVVIIFHAAGIASTVIGTLSVIQKITKKALLIEDCVQQLLDPQTVKPVNEKHFLMDSLRKVTPLYGSFLYGTKKGMQFSQTKRFWSMYTIHTTLLYMLFRMVLVASYVLNKPSIAVFAHKKILKNHDDIMGDTVAHRGIWGIAWVSQWLNREAVERVKREQTKIYEHMFKPLYTKSSPFYRIMMKRSNYGKLHVYPVGLKKKMDGTLLSYLKRKNIVVWSKFPDSKWSTTRDILFFPLGFHMNKEKIKRITKALTVWKNGAWKEEFQQNKVSSPHLLVRAAEYLLSF
ncbi:MAG: hypothetical protein WAV51_04480 [Microgenomates group bacterium]